MTTLHGNKNLLTFLCNLLRDKCFVSETSPDTLTKAVLPTVKKSSRKAKAYGVGHYSCSDCKRESGTSEIQDNLLIPFAQNSGPNHSPSPFPGLACVSNAYDRRWGDRRCTGSWGSLGGRLSRLREADSSVPSGGSSRQLRGRGEREGIMLQGEVLGL
jgi:hypothetical protein